MRTAASFLFLATLVVAARAQGEPESGLVGKVADSVYTSPTGAFRMEIPVLADLGGTIRDTSNVVTFHDTFGTQISVAAFPHDATQRWELSTRGIKDYLIYYFENFVLPDFKRFCPQTTVESAGFSADLMEGSLFTYILLPGGSMFADRLPFGQPGAPPVAKRGNLLFVKNGFTFVISTELSERVTEGASFKKTPEEENKLLRGRLVDVLKKITFIRPEAAPTPTPTPPRITTPDTSS
jgi:hypothetical protein